MTPGGNPYDVANMGTGLDAFLTKYPSTQFVFVQWLDYLGQIRMRVLPIAEFAKLIRKGGRISISNGNLGTLQNDHLTSVCNPVGAMCVEPDATLASLRPMQNLGPIKNAATIMARFVDAGKFEPLELCPRASLEGLVKTFENEFKVNFLVGFEIEITFCKRNCPSSSSSEKPDTFTPLDTTHAWGTFTDEQYTTSYPLTLEIISTLSAIGIQIQHMHAESGPGQYEFVLPPLPPLQAVDTLIQARQCIMQIAATRNLRATCYPTPFPCAGSGSHAHLSLNSTSLFGRERVELEMSFMASVLHHLPALCAFTLPQKASYGRVADDSWSGGKWVAWGTQNREVPVRRAEGRWEVRCLDGCANMYLALAAILAAGLAGVRNKVQMKLGDCPRNPTALSDAEKRALGIVTLLPGSLDEALAAAEGDAELEGFLPGGVLRHFCTLKREEQSMLAAMGEGERRIWLMERY